MGGPPPEEEEPLLCDQLIAAALRETGYRDDEPPGPADPNGAAADVTRLLGSAPSRAALSAASAAYGGMTALHVAALAGARGTAAASKMASVPARCPACA